MDDAVKDVLGALKGIAESLDKAVADESHRGRTVKAIVQQLPTIQQYLRASDARTTIAVLACEEMTLNIEWWSELGTIDRVQFLETAYSIRKGLFGLEGGLQTL